MDILVPLFLRLYWTSVQCSVLLRRIIKLLITQGVEWKIDQIGFGFRMTVHSLHSCSLRSFPSLLTLSYVLPSDHKKFRLTTEEPRDYLLFQSLKTESSELPFATPLPYENKTSVQVSYRGEGGNDSRTHPLNSDHLGVSIDDLSQRN